MYSRNEHNIVYQLYSRKNNLKKYKIGRKPESPFFQRGHTDSYQTHQKMLNIANYQGSASQKYKEIPPYTYQNCYHPKDKT